jgi:hypothetical protein
VILAVNTVMMMAMACAGGAAQGTSSPQHRDVDNASAGADLACWTPGSPLAQWIESDLKVDTTYTKKAGPPGPERRPSIIR